MYNKLSIKSTVLFVIIGLTLILVHHLVDQTVGLCNISFLPQYREFEDARPLENSSIPFETLWSRETQINNQDTTIIIADDLVIVPDGGCNEIVAFATHTGKVKWRDTASGLMGRVIYDRTRNRIYITRIAAKRELVAYQVTDGKQLWSNNTLGGQRIGIRVQDVGQDNQVFLQADTYGLFPVNPHDGSYAEPLNINRSTFAFDGQMFLWIDNRKEVYASDFETNDTLWSFSSPIVECCLDELSSSPTSRLS